MPSKPMLSEEDKAEIRGRLNEKVLEANRRERSREGFARPLKELYREYAAKPFLYNVGTPDFRSFAAKLPEEAARQMKLDSFAFFRQVVQAAGLRLIAAVLLIAGLGLAAAGVLLRSRGCLLLGGAGVVNGAVLRRESRKRRESM